MDLNCAKPRVNASMLPALQGRVVTLMGIAHSVSNCCGNLIKSRIIAHTFAGDGVP